MYFISILTAVIIITQLIKYWYLSKGYLLISYYLTIIAAISCCILETKLALAHPEQLSIIFFNILYVWMVVMAIKGICRLKKGEHKMDE